MAKESSDEMKKLEEEMHMSESSEGEESGREDNEVLELEEDWEDIEEIKNPEDTDNQGDLQKEELSKGLPLESNRNTDGSKLQGPSKEKRKFGTLNIIKNIFPFKSSEKSVPASRGIKRSKG
ncbi:uncharacterized protein LOC134259609, partial [Saccostrea cucullata]|uniref:uncharacterized protein LOC134259609 n=1 Tax=Saccostrea cuccullata TaxID=36930 RepID=UPI002ED5E7F3